MTKPKQHEDDIIIQIIVIISILITHLTGCNPMSYLSELRKFYPKSWKARIAIQRYNTHLEWEHQDPTTITIHETTLNYGGPEEGGWHYYVGYPCLTHCIFSKKQAIKEYLIYSEEYEVWEQPDLGLTSTHSNYDISYSNDYAKFYPTERPYYC
jgi:hypothetical protein